MFKFLLKTTSLILILLSPALCMDPETIETIETKPTKPTQKHRRFLSSSADLSLESQSLVSSTDSLWSRSKKGGKHSSSSTDSPIPNRKKDPLEKQFQSLTLKADYAKAESKYYRGLASVCSAELESKEHLNLTKNSERGGFDKVDEKQNSSDAALALEKKKGHLITATTSFEKAIKLGYSKAQYDLAVVFEQLAEIDPTTYDTSEKQRRIFELYRGAAQAGSNRAATKLSILGKDPRSTSTIPEEKPKKRIFSRKNSNGS